MKSKNLVCGIVGFIIGAGSGIAGTYFFMKSKCEDIIEEEVNKYIEWYQEQNSTVDIDNEEPSDVNPNKENDKESSKRERIESVIQSMSNIHKKHKNRDYTQYSDVNTGIERDDVNTNVQLDDSHPVDSDEDDEEIVQYHPESDPDNGAPGPNTMIYTIPGDKMGDIGFDMDELEYYIADDSLVSDGKEVFDVDKLVGDCVDNIVDKYSVEQIIDDIQRIYVRNITLRTDYEVNFINEEFLP